MEQDNKEYSSLENLQNSFISENTDSYSGRDNAPSDLTLARAKQSIKKEGDNLFHENAENDYSERILLTSKGEKTVYDAVSPCNRCGACAAVCPSYKAKMKENLSPRGRCQLTRLLKEYRIKQPDEALKEAISSCFLCGACENLCHAEIPVREIVLDLRRHYLKQNPGFLRKIALRLKLNHIRLYEFWLRTAFLMLKLRLPWFAKILGVHSLIGRTPEELRNLVFEPPLKFGTDLLKNYKNPPKHNVKWVYFSSCETNYVMPKVASATVELLERHEGEGMLAGNVCCGFLSYRMGNIEEAKAFAKRNIEIFEQLRKDHNEKFIIVTDCSSCAAFLKNYERLFIKDKLQEEVLLENAETVQVIKSGKEEEDEYFEIGQNESEYKNTPDENQKGEDIANDETRWRERARAFSAAVRDISEIFSPSDFSKIEKCDEEEGKTVCYQHSCSAIYSQKISSQPLQLIRHIAGKCLKDFSGSAECCGGTKGNLPVPQDIKDSSIKRKIRSIADAQANIVISTDPCCIHAIQSGLKKWYPQANACHLSVYINEAEKNRKQANIQNNQL